MSSERAAFLTSDVEPLERMLSGLELGSLFTGILYESVDQRLLGLTLEGFGAGVLRLSPVEIGRLFMAPDESIVAVRRLREQRDGTPAGVSVFSDHAFVEEGEPVVVIAYQDDTGAGLRIDALRLSRILLAPDAPARLCTVAFGLMACTACRLGFSKITLYAAGNGRFGRAPGEDDLIGYLIWPKFGFDAPLVPADLNRAPHLAHCASVQDVLAADAPWWTRFGRGREMTFDLEAGSRSWGVLLHYLYDVFAGELP